MRMITRWTVIGAALAVVIAAFGLLAGCRSASDGSVFEGANTIDTLMIGVAPDYPPVIYKEAGTFAGIEADFARAIGKALNRPIKFVECNWDDLMPALRDCRVDIIMSGMSITPSRRMQVAFVEPYMRVGQLALMRGVDVPRFPTAREIIESHANVGVQRGTTGDRLVQQMFKNAKRIPYASPTDAAEDLKRRRIDLMIHDAPMVWWLVSEHEGSLAASDQLLTEEYLAWGVRRGDAKFLAQLNQLVKDWEANGTLDRIIRNWLPDYPGKK